MLTRISVFWLEINHPIFAQMIEEPVKFLKKTSIDNSILIKKIINEIYDRKNHV